ncbi:TPA: polysaccharide deacetylase family protein [Candidatus Woesearchaeota archaeon]|nr:polysaccharide deacetylase family protein [Candidatus Woesearchaeota archaeon]HIH47927.1 polysaccharide deacetylase family protein [Candidatus Woesearchaeota archaeon]HII89192.1 polysaccharide deacetylase family protein [Candidatus Woesearchaeota archaeon]
MDGLRYQKGPPTVTIVMYHYVRDVEKTEYPGIHAVSFKRFNDHLALLKKLGYHFISLDHYYDHISKGVAIPQKSCVLTFDDGIRDHYTHVFPILKKEGIPGVFYPVTQPLTESIVPIVQKIHFILGKMSAVEFAREVNAFLKHDPSLFHEYEVHDHFKINPQKRFDDNLTANLKHNLARMPLVIKKKIVDSIFHAHFPDEHAFCDELYMDFEELKEMLEAGMTIGSQTHTHPFLSSLSSDKQEREIIQATSLLEKNLGIKIKHFCYPYGGYNKDTIGILRDHGYDTAMTIKLGVNQGPIDPLEIKRINCNDVDQLQE